MTVETQRHISLCKTCVGQSVSGISFDRLTEILNTSVKTFCRSLSPIKSSFQVKMIGLYILGVAFGQQVPFLRRQLQAQLFGDIPCDVFLDCEDVCGFSAMLFAP